ncbi:hypothetical protein [Campylobacter jejuni]|uniref:hypothetical protein n=1 Tax=Campylobacter jejuni TaxID=197 RepID=UPI0015D57A2D|nr:hypothetical protein [Campylobacter jejuni]
MKKSKSIQIIKQQGIAEFIKYKKIKIYTKYEKAKSVPFWGEKKIFITPKVR